MFFVEICNLTEKFSSNTHQFVTKICNHSSQKVHTTIQADNQSFQKLRTFNCKVHFATISTVSLTSYINFRQKKGNLRKSIHQCEHITYQQKSNQKDIIQINEDICKLNTLNGTRSIRLAKDVTKYFTKKGGGEEMGAIVKKFKIFNLITFKTRSIQMQGLHINCFLSNKFTIFVYINDSQKRTTIITLFAPYYHCSPVPT